MEKLLYFTKTRNLSFCEEFLNLVHRDDGLFEIISTGLLGTLHSDDLAVFLTQRTQGCNYFLCHNT